jgi:hypothetical protein
MQMKTILLQAITQTGSISADWFLVVLVGIIGFLITVLIGLATWTILGIAKSLKSAVDSLTNEMKAQGEHLTIHDMNIIELRKDVEYHQQAYEKHLVTYHKP